METEDKYIKGVKFSFQKDFDDKLLDLQAKFAKCMTLHVRETHELNPENFKNI